MLASSPLALVALSAPARWSAGSELGLLGAMSPQGVASALERLELVPVRMQPVQVPGLAPVKARWLVPV